MVSKSLRHCFESVVLVVFSTVFSKIMRFDFKACILLDFTSDRVHFSTPSSDPSLNNTNVLDERRKPG